MKRKYWELAMNLLIILTLCMSLTINYLAFDSYEITLWGINHELLYEDVMVTTYTSFRDFDKSACEISQNEVIIAICEDLSSFQISGWILSLVCIFSLAMSCYYCLIIWQQKAQKYLRLLLPIVYGIGSLLYFVIISSTNNTLIKSALSYEIGCFFIFLANALIFVSTGLFYYNYSNNLNNYEEFDNAKGLNTEEILMEKRVNSELQAENQYTNKSENPFDAKKYGQENSKKFDEDIWEKFNDIKTRLELNLKESRIKPEKNNLEVLERVLNELKQLSVTDLSKEKKQLESEREDLDSTVKSLTEEIEMIRKTKAKEDESTRNHMLNIEIERKILMEKLERANSELKSLRNKNLPVGNEEITRIAKESEVRLQEIEQCSKIIHDKQNRIIELENCIKKHENSEVKYAMQIEELKNALKEEIPNISEIDSEIFNEQLSSYTEALKKSKNERSQIENSFQVMASKNAKLEVELEETIKKHNESLKQIEVLKKNLITLLDNKSSNEKTIENYSSPSSLIESLKEQDSRSTEKKYVVMEKYEMCKSSKKLAKKDLKAANQHIKKLEENISELENLTKTLSGQTEKQKSNLNEHLKNYKSQEQEWDSIKNELVYSNTQQSREIEILQLRINTQESFFENELQNSQLENSMIKDQLLKFTELSEFYKAEYSRFKVLETRLNAEIPDGLSEYRDIIDEQARKISENLLMYEGKICKLTSEKEKLRKKLMEAENEIQAISIECQTLHKKNFESNKDSILSLGSMDSFSRSVQDSLIIEGISPSIIFHNPLIEKVSKLRKEPPMTYATLWKTLELMIIEKHKIDLADISMAREPRSAADYMFEFMYQKYGLKALGLKQLKALITSLEELYKLNHPYAIFFCRLLGIFHSRPIPIRFIMYLCCVQEKFIQISTKLKANDQNYSDFYDVQQFGGEASIIDIVELVKKIFKSHRTVGERILERLHAEQPDKLEITILKVCGKVYKEGKDDKYIFEALKASDGILDYQEFIDGLRLTLDIWISQEDAENLCSFLDETETGAVSYENWKNRISFEDQVKKIYTKPAMITKVDFLNSFICEYELQIVEEYYALRKIVKGNMLTAQKAFGYFIQFEPTLSVEAQERLFKEAIVHEGGTGDQASNEALCIIILKHNLGGYGKGLLQLETLQKAIGKS